MKRFLCCMTSVVAMHFFIYSFILKYIFNLLYLNCLCKAH
uniref:Uncharacterized protein n=1 Tax=Anguilla anguilla TaxID=7936 RepID=A0A0E9QW04_ANGAN